MPSYCTKECLYNRKYARKMMVLCDSCNCWFHLRCIGQRESAVQSQHAWFCPACKVSKSELVAVVVNAMGECAKNLVTREIKAGTNPPTSSKLSMKLRSAVDSILEGNGAENSEPFGNSCDSQSQSTHLSSAMKVDIEFGGPSSHQWQLSEYFTLRQALRKVGRKWSDIQKRYLPERTVDEIQIVAESAQFQRSFAPSKSRLSEIVNALQSKASMSTPSLQIASEMEHSINKPESGDDERKAGCAADLMSNSDRQNEKTMWQQGKNDCIIGSGNDSKDTSASTPSSMGVLIAAMGSLENGTESKQQQQNICVWEYSNLGHMDAVDTLERTIDMPTEPQTEAVIADKMQGSCVTMTYSQADSTCRQTSSQETNPSNANPKSIIARKCSPPSSQDSTKEKQSVSGKWASTSSVHRFATSRARSMLARAGFAKPDANAGSRSDFSVESDQDGTVSAVAECLQVQSTPEKKRVHWKPSVAEFHITPLNYSDDEVEEEDAVGEDEGVSNRQRQACAPWDMSKDCGGCDDLAKMISKEYDISEDKGNGNDDIANDIAEDKKIGNDDVANEEIRKSDAVREEQIAEGEAPQSAGGNGSNAAQATSDCMPARQNGGSAVMLNGGLTEDEKRAAMKRRYECMQQGLVIPAEERRRLKREQLRSLLPVWKKKG